MSSSGHPFGITRMDDIFPNSTRIRTIRLHSLKLAMLIPDNVPAIGEKQLYRIVTKCSINLPQVRINFEFLTLGMHYGNESKLVPTWRNDGHIRNVILRVIANNIF